MNTYYAEYNGLSVQEYVDKYVYASEEEMSRMRRTLDFIPHDVSSLLDVGAGHGVLLSLLNQLRGIKGVGIEVTEAKIEYGRSQGLDMRLGDASRLDFPDKSFDAVISCEVIEHLPYGVYESALREFCRVARKYVLVSVPFDEKRIFVECPYCGATSNPSFHMRSFNTENLAHLMKGARLDQTWTLGSIRQTPLLLRVARRPSWPRFLVCQSCGYRANQSQSNSDGAKAKSGPFGALKRTAASVVRKMGKKKPRWIVARYVVHDGGRSDE